MIAGDLHGHVGRSADGYKGVPGGFGYGDRNSGDRILEFDDATVGCSKYKVQEMR